MDAEESSLSAEWRKGYGRGNVRTHRTRRMCAPLRESEFRTVETRLRGSHSQRGKSTIQTRMEEEIEINRPQTRRTAQKEKKGTSRKRFRTPRGKGPNPKKQTSSAVHKVKQRNKRGNGSGKKGSSKRLLNRTLASPEKKGSRAGQGQK